MLLLATDEYMLSLCCTFDSLCEPLDKDNVNDVSTFASDLSGNFAGVVQYNKDNRAFEVNVPKKTFQVYWP